MVSESEVQTLRAEFQGLKELLTDWFEQTEKHVDEQFKQIPDQLKEMKSLSKGTDELLRGNKENIGMNGRLNHAEKLQKIFLWVGGIILTAFVAHYLGLIDQLRNVASAG